ncbi:hypothetical protein B484DRAFT_455695 [Ochromonadaceae sp. CCMP2298]|nr:hypothetical protein B484DRAFT_455695 [Ochromonadaceae sp. CCMP2298]
MPLAPKADPLFEGDGLSKSEASRLLVLMCHARTCTAAHSEEHAQICKSTKYLMLHLRDCSGTDLHGRACLFPWCRPCRRMLRHLTECYEPDTCEVCNPPPWCLPRSFQQLRGLNEQKFCQMTKTQSQGQGVGQTGGMGGQGQTQGQGVGQGQAQ